ncbi:MAG: homocysteine S-methyltransferase family protein [Chloroflexi bacterium]|nr:homocysteine S-methyltransferase family protein [Chloroflexota bacterium]
MNRFLQTLGQGPLLADGAMGSYLFELTGRLSEQNHVYEAFNVERPELVLQVHLEYLNAGARAISTNTFGANEAYLSQLGESGRVEEINRQGVEIARQAITSFAQESGRSASEFFVLGSVGPVHDPDADIVTLRSTYIPHLTALHSEQVDAIVLETFASSEHAFQVTKLSKEIAPDIPVVVQLSLDEAVDALSTIPDAPELVAAAVESGADVIGINCSSPWDVESFIDSASQLNAVQTGDLLLSAMPNAGGFRRIGQRFMNHVNPEFMGRTARDYMGKGVRLIGGCCEVHPAHVREMAAYLKSAGGGNSSVPSLSGGSTSPVSREAKRSNGPFSRKIVDGEFAVSVELLPPRGTASRSTQSKVSFISEVAQSGLVDAVDITDGSRGIPLMPPGDFISLVRSSLGIGGDADDPVELIPHFSTRDLNTMGLQARLIGLHARNIRNVLIVTGDPPKMSPTYPRSTAVFDLDSTTLIGYVHGLLNAGVDFGGMPLSRGGDPNTSFTIGSGFEPEAPNIEFELEKLRRKIDSGVDYIFTQPVFDSSALAPLDLLRRDVPILPGVLVLNGFDHARRMAMTPGVRIPDAIFRRLERFDQPDDQVKEARALAAEQVRAVKDSGWAGAYLMSPAGHQGVSEVLGQGLS